MTQCDRYMATGGRCELEVGHDGEHQKTYETRVARWTDQSQADLIAKYGGTRGT